MLNNFCRIKTGVHVGVLLDAINQFESSGDGVEVIYLRKPVTEESQECVDQEAFHHLPEVVPFVFGLMSAMQGERLGSILLTRVKPGFFIQLHTDMVGMEKYYDRFHIVVNANKHCFFTCGEETTVMQPGEVWWFDHTKPHSISNDGDSDRIHLIVDIKTRSFK